jgi:hypothetical protein
MQKPDILTSWRNSVAEDGAQMKSERRLALEAKVNAK